MQTTWLVFSIFLQISLNNKDTLAIVGHRELLCASDTLQALQTAALGKHDIHFEAITDLEIKLTLVKEGSGVLDLDVTLGCTRE